MIKEATIREFLLTQQAEKKANKTAREMKAKREQLELEMISALHDNQRVEPCDYKLAIEEYEKRYIPSYKDCAIEFGGGEAAVIQWVDENHPHEQAERIVVEMKPQKKAA